MWVLEIQWQGHLIGKKHKKGRNKIFRTVGKEDAPIPEGKVLVKAYDVGGTLLGYLILPEGAAWGEVETNTRRALPQYVAVPPDNAQTLTVMDLVVDGITCLYADFASSSRQD